MNEEQQAAFDEGYQVGLKDGKTDAYNEGYVAGLKEGERTYAELQAKLSALEAVRNCCG